MSIDPSVAFIDTHITAMLTGLVIGEILSFLSFDIRLILAIIRKRQLRPMPLAYLISRYTMAVGICVLAWLSLPIAQGGAGNPRALHWLRAVVVPLLFTSTSAVLGYRAVILHYERPRIISLVIHTLLLAEFFGGVIVMTLCVADPTDPTQKLSSTTAASISPAWLSGPLFMAISIDFIFTLIVVVPILRRKEKPRKGEVVHMLLSDAAFFGVFSIVVKALALGFVLSFEARTTNPYLPLRMESVASTIFACRLFRGQEGFLRHQKERMADPTLAGIELDGLTAAASSLHGSAKGDEIVEVEAVDVEKGIHLESRKEGRKGSVETTRREASVTFIDICVEHSAKDEAGNLEKGQC